MSPDSIIGNSSKNPSSYNRSNIPQVYAFCDRNSWKAEKEYNLRYPYRQEHNRDVFVSLRQRLGDIGSFRKACEMGHDLLSATIAIHVLSRVEKDPTVSSQILTREGGLQQSKVMTILHKIQYLPYHFTLVQIILRSDFEPQITCAADC